ELVGHQAHPADSTGQISVAQSSELVTRMSSDKLFSDGTDLTPTSVVPPSPEREQERLTASRVVHEALERDVDLGALGGVGRRPPSKESDRENLDGVILVGIDDHAEQRCTGQH